MAIQNHQHDWASTNSGYRCLSCDAVITNTEIAANLSSDSNLTHCWKKAGH